MYIRKSSEYTEHTVHVSIKSSIKIKEKEKRIHHPYVECVNLSK